MSLALMALMALAAAAWLTHPLWRKQLPRTQARRAANVAAFRQRTKEIEADAAAGLLDADTAQSLREELDARLLRDAEDAAPVSAQPRRRGVIAVALAALMLFSAAGGYWMQGSWKQQASLLAGTTGEGVPGSVEDMVARLEQRMQQSPGQVEGWALLGRSYFVMERFADAARAYARANELTKAQDAALLVDEGESLALARDRDLQGRPRALFAAALKLEPQNGKALWYAGLAAEQAQDLAQAQSYWKALSTQELPEPLRAALNEKLQTGGAAPVSSSADESAVRLRLAVSLKPELRAQLPADATLFVFARAAEGPPMPLAVYRGKASELPREISLDDSMSMTPALKLSQFPRWLVTARISASGQAQAQSGDIQGSLTVERARAGGAALGLVLDQVVP